LASEEELASVRPRLLGLIDERRIVAVDIPRPDRSIIDAFLSLGDLSSSVSDALDVLGVGGHASASDLPPLHVGCRVCGPAITIRYAREGGNLGALRTRGERAKLADRDLYGVGREGDIAVFDCHALVDASVMGGLSAHWARRTGMAACIVDGAVRDVDTMRTLGYPVWARGRTPRSGKHRLEAVEINGTVEIAGVMVRPGDLVVADDTGVCVIPLSSVDDVLRNCQEAEGAERELIEAIDEGRPVEHIVGILHPERW
jgi:4-hydroxy-4-methyl-2-oxoglutarate aldolase